MLLNLLANAVKFTSIGSVTVKVKDYSLDDQNFIEINIIDTGKGIKDEDKSKIFKLFGFTNSSESSNTSGIGLGTTLAKLIID